MLSEVTSAKLSDDLRICRRSSGGRSVKILEDMLRKVSARASLDC